MMVKRVQLNSHCIERRCMIGRDKLCLRIVIELYNTPFLAPCKKCTDQSSCKESLPGVIRAMWDGTYSLLVETLISVLIPRDRIILETSRIKRITSPYISPSLR